MGAVVLQSIILFWMIVLGFVTKRVGLLNKSDGNVLGRIVMNVTLPAVIIINLARLILQKELAFLVFLGLVWTIGQLILAYFLAKQKEKLIKLFYLYGFSGFNIGNFAIPFIQSTIPVGLPLVLMFDIGNSIMLSGGTKIVVDQMVHKEEPVHLKSILKQLFSSVPFVCYVVMLLLKVTAVDVSENILSFINPIADANIFLSMFMIGLFMELHLPKTMMAEVLRVLFIRFGLGMLIFILLYFLPIQALTKMVLSLLAFSPIPLFNIMLAVQDGVKEEWMGVSASISFLISLPLMTTVLLVYQ